MFQPAEEGAPPGEKGGASEMLAAAIFDEYKPGIMVGWHAWASLNTGIIGYRSGPFMASSQAWKVLSRADRRTARGRGRASIRS